MDIGIIGMGIAGISILKEIEKQKAQDLIQDMTITVFSEIEGFGTGFPYQPDDSALLINQYTETMSIDLDDQDDFLKWVKDNRGLRDLHNTHLPRNLFGEYLYQETLRLIDKLGVRVIREQVIAINPLGSGKFTVKTERTEQTLDSVHLSIGHLAYQDPYKLKGKERYIYNPYPAMKKLAFPNKLSKVGIIGTGLTAIDTYLYMKKTHPEATLSFISLEGRFSSVRGHEPDIKPHYLCPDKIEKILDQSDEGVSLEMIKDWFYKETRTHGIDLTWVWQNLGEGTVKGMQVDLKHTEELGRFQALIQSIRDCYPIIWNALPDKEKDLFLEAFGQKWSFFKAPIPQQTARQLIQDLTKGEVEVLSDIDSIVKEEDHFKVALKDQSEFTFDYIVNGTGQQMNLLKEQHLQQPLVRQLIKDKVLVPYRYGGVLIDYPSMNALDQNGELISGLRVYGQMASGIQYGNSSVEMTAKSARYGVRAMLENVNNN